MLANFRNRGLESPLAQKKQVMQGEAYEGKIGGQTCMKATWTVERTL